MKTMTIDQQIIELLATSSIAPMMKSIIEVSLPVMAEKNKENVLNHLKKEQKNLVALKKKEEKIIDKYQGIMKKLSAIQSKTK